mgnify:CR=1 FL=1
MNLDFITNSELLYGKIIEFSGAISFKTSCMLSMIKNILTNDENAIVLYIDADNHMCLKYLKDHDIDSGRCIISTCNDPDIILSIVSELKNNYSDHIVIVIDSISNLKFNSPFKDLSKFIIRLSRLICNTQIVVYAVNQFRYNNNQKRFVSYCSKCFDLYSSLRFIIINKNENELYLKIQKNKINNQTGYLVVNIGTSNEYSISENRE